MATRKAKLKAADRRRIVGEKYLTGMSQYKIADEVGVTQATISRDIKRLHEQWVKEGTIAYEHALVRELRRIDKIEVEAWENWELSKDDIRQTGQKTKEVNHGEGEDTEPILTATTSTIKKATATGDPQYMKIIQWCVEQRCKLLRLPEQLGLLDPVIIDEPLMIDVDQLTPNQLERYREFVAAMADSEEE